MPLPPLSPEQLVKPRYFEARIALMFASLFVSTGINLPYFPLWLEANGFDAERIAVILAAPMFLRVVTTPFLTAYADTASDRANVLLVLVAAALVLSCGFFLPPVYGVVLAVSLALNVVWTPQGPLVDSLALSGVRRFGSNYTGMRIWGSISFLAANLLGGVILSWTSPQAVPVIITASFVVGLADGADRAAPRQAAARLAAFGRGIAAGAEIAQPLLRAVHHRRRRHQRQPRLHVRLRVDLLEVGRPRRHADRFPVGVCRGLGSACLHVLHARVRPLSGDHADHHFGHRRDRALDRLSAGVAAGAGRDRLLCACRRCMACRPASR